MFYVFSPVWHRVNIKINIKSTLRYQLLNQYVVFILFEAQAKEKYAGEIHNAKHTHINTQEKAH